MVHTGRGSLWSAWSCEGECGPLKRASIDREGVSVAVGGHNSLVAT